VGTSFTGKTALVTGASRGIGKAIAVALVEHGANVVLSSRKQDALDEVAEEIRAKHPEAQVLAKAAHVSDQAAAQECIEASIDAFGSLDILINNAGTNPYFGPLVDLDAPRAQKIFEINQLAMVTWTQLAWKKWMQANGGAIVNIASIGGMTTEPGIGFYNATKAAVIHLTRQFAAELAPGVRVNAIAPGVVRTHLAKALWENFEKQLSAKLPMRRIGEPEDIAKAALFLAGDDSSWMTGQTMVVDGGALVLPQVTL
jgi:NAD(P)-dependent dehydrogenase (short-subunit alcohol dehydrogenase family)